MLNSYSKQLLRNQLAFSQQLRFTFGGSLKLVAFFLFADFNFTGMARLLIDC